MVSESFWLDDENEEWLDKKLLNIDGKEWVKSIEIHKAINPGMVTGLESFLVDDESKDWLSKKWVDPSHWESGKMIPDKAKPMVRMTRKDKDSSWELHGVSEKEAIDQSKLDNLANSLKHLDFYHLPPADWSEEKMGRGELAYFTAELFDGRIIHINIGTMPESEDKRYYMKLRMSLKEGIENEALITERDTFNQKIQSRVYGVSNWIGEKFLKNQSDFIKKEEKEAA